MSSYLPCGTYFETYSRDQRWWRTPFIKGKMILMIILLVLFPILVHFEWINQMWLSVAYNVNYYILAALGVQLLIGYCGQITLGHAAFVAVGAFSSALLVIYGPWPQFLRDLGLVYPLSMIISGVLAGLWSVLFGLPSARVKGFYLIMTTMAAQWITVRWVITQYVSKIGGREQAISIPPGTIAIGPWVIDNDYRFYILSTILVALCLIAMGNLVRTKMGRAWIAIRDNDIAAETMGVNIVTYKLLAFFIAGFFGGIAGSFYISTLSVVSPEHYDWYFSLMWVGIILIGGVGSIQGLVFGSIFIVVILKLLDLLVLSANDFLIDSYPSLAWITTKILYFEQSAFGLAIILFLIYEPNGLSYRYWQLKNYFNLWPFSYTGK